MGRINANYIIYIFKRRLLGFLPYKVRRPFILLFSIIGLITYYNVMVSVSGMLFNQPSKYLLGFGDFVISIYQNIKTSTSDQLLIIGGIFVIIILIYKYCIVDSKDDNNNRQDKKEIYKARSWYYQINSCISLLYLLITILTFLPFIGG